ncbi:MAG: alpha/beta fold hydrolase [Acidimicrobiia bacterium]
MSRWLAIEWPGGRVSGRLTGSGGTGILLAHGAGTNQDHSFMVLLRDGLAAAGHTVLTFNYPYAEKGSRRPDLTERLLECHRAAADHLATRADLVFLAGRSMGGRIGTYLAATGYPTAGLILYAYPLHPAGKPERLRIGQFADIRAPMLFFQGTRDALARMDLFQAHIGSLPGVEVEILEGASHSTRGGGWTEGSMSGHLVERTTTWVRAVSSGKPSRSRP